ncbi:MAG: hypothetical protein ACLVB1_06085 [Blautia obeum]
MSKKLHSGLKRTLAWMLVVALMVQGCMVVYADDFQRPEAVVSDESLMKMPVQKVTKKY